MSEMESVPFGRVPPGAALTPTPFRVAIPDEDLETLQILLKHSRVTPANYENTRPNRELGVNREWIADRVEDWRTTFDWRQHEQRLNSVPQFRTDIPFRNGTFGVHFLALFSQAKDVPAVLITHGSFGGLIEFLPFIEAIRAKYTPDNLPFHVIMPSLPGGGFSDRPPVDADFVLQDIAYLYDQLMTGLGFTQGYVTIGNDFGYRISRQVVGFEQCRGLLTHTFRGTPPPDFVERDATEHDLKRREWFTAKTSAYLHEYSSRMATIGLVLASNPVGLLAWLSEKYLDWTDVTPSNEDILALVSLQWLTNSLPTSISVYRQLLDPARRDQCNPPLTKPLGYAYYPLSLNPVRRDFLEAHGDLVFYREHEKGGHFPLWEVPQDVLSDIEGFLEIIFRK